jgi:hypothetical protein
MKGNIMNWNKRYANEISNRANSVQEWLNNLSLPEDWAIYQGHRNRHFAVGTCASCGDVHEMPVHPSLLGVNHMFGQPIEATSSIAYDHRGGGCLHQNNDYGQWDTPYCYKCGSEEHNTMYHWPHRVKSVNMGGA